MASLRLVGLEFRRSIGPLVVPLLVLGVWWLISDDVMPRNVQLWPLTSQLTIAMAFLLAPAGGGLSAWAATRNRRRGMEEMLAVTARPPVVRELATWTGTMLWPLLACAAVAGYYVFLAFKDATWGRLLPMPLLFGLLSIAAYSALGYAAGRWVPSRFTVPLVAVGLFYGAWGLLLVFPHLPGLFGPDPNGISYVSVFSEPVGLWGWRILWMLGLGGAALSAVALKVRRSPAHWASFVVSILVAALGAGTLANIAAGDESMVSDGLLEGKPIPYELVCEEGRITVCVHPAYEDLLLEAAATVNEVAEPLAGIPGVPTRMVHESTTVEPEARRRKDTATLDAYALAFIGSGEFKGSTAWTLVQDEEAIMIDEGPVQPSEPSDEDLRRCGEVGEGLAPMDPVMEAQAVVGGWLLERAGGRSTQFGFTACANHKQVVERFATLDPVKRRAWLEENYAELRAGELTLGDLP